MSKNKTVRSVFLAIFCFFTAVSLAYAESCSTINQVQYKPEGSCETSERICCADKQWSEWVGDCNSCECTPGAKSGMNCSVYYDQSNYNGDVSMTCNSNCKWDYDTSACKTSVFVQYVFEAEIPKFYYWEGTFGCPNYLQYVPVYYEQGGGKAAEFQTDRSYSSDSGGGERTAYLTSEVFELESDTDYIIGGGIYDCLNKMGRSQISFRCDELPVYFGTVYPGQEGSSASNPLIMDGNTCSAY